MRTRPLGRTGLEIGELVLGTWGLSGDAYGPVPDAEVDAVLDRALALGVDAFDTADAYGLGSMETRLGARLARHEGKSVVVTKIRTDRSAPRARKRFDAEYLREACERSRERLGRPKHDVLLLHNPSLVTVTRGEAAETMRALVAEEKATTWGVSAGDFATARAAIEGGAPVVELPYNALWSGGAGALMLLARDRGTGLLARSVLAHGLLTGHWPRDRSFPQGDHRAARWSPPDLAARTDQVRVLRTALSGDVPTQRAVALRFVLAADALSGAVIGPRNVRQLEQLVREAGDGPPYLPDAAFTRLVAELEQLGIRA